MGKVGLKWVIRGCSIIVCTLQLAALLYLGMSPLSTFADSTTCLAELLPAEGFFIQKPIGHLTLPASPPSVAVGMPRALAGRYNPVIQTMVSSVSQTEIYTTILNLQDEDETPGWDANRSRYSYSPELVAERNYIHNRMQMPGLSIRYQYFSYGGTSQDNIEGTLDGWGPGSDLVYIVCAHYDSTSTRNARMRTAPGADDNASGVAAVLEAARVLSQYRFKRTLRFVVFAAEEQGLIGSQYYVSQARSAGTSIGGAINLDMIAWDSDDDNAMGIHTGTRSDSQALGRAFLKANTTYGVSLAPKYITASATTSDHARFWDQGYPAILVTEDLADFNPYHHSTGDTLAKLDLPYAVKFVRATVATLADLAEILPPGVEVTHSGPATVIASRPTSLTIQYGNPSPSPAMGVVITDTLGPGLGYMGDDSGFIMTQPTRGTLMWQVGYVAPYSRSTFVVTASVGTRLPPGTRLTSTVYITGVIASDDPKDNQATWTGFVSYARTLFLPVIFKHGH